MGLSQKVKRQRKKFEMSKEEMDEFILGIAAEKAKAMGINGLFILPYDTRLEIPKADLSFRKACRRIKLVMKALKRLLSY